MRDGNPDLVGGGPTKLETAIVGLTSAFGNFRDANPDDEAKRLILEGILAGLVSRGGHERYELYLQALLNEIESDLERAKRELGDDEVLLSVATSTLEPLADSVAEMLRDLKNGEVGKPDTEDEGSNYDKAVFVRPE